MKSIRQYLFARLVWGSVVILVVSNIVLGLLMRHLDIVEFDETLEIKARTLATLVLREDRVIAIDFADQYMREFQSTEEPEYFQFRLDDGNTIGRSGMLGDSDLPFDPTLEEEAAFGNLRLPDQRRGRYVQIAFFPREKGEEEVVERDQGFLIPETVALSRTPFVVLTLARGRGALDALLSKIFRILACTTILLAGLFVISVRTALDKGLYPLVSLDKQIENLRRYGLERRIALPDAPREIAMLPETLNSLLDELQDSFDRERRFVSDAAHELRTPVAEFRAACEVGARWSDDPVLVRRRFENLQQSSGNMEKMLNALLELSQFDSGQIRVSKTDISIAALLNHCWERALAAEPDRQVQLENLFDSVLQIKTDKLKLELLLSNLLGNALCYSTQGSVVTCAGGKLADGRHELRISNPVHDLVQEDLQHIFERFWRKDAARTGGRHSGLGLSIVKTIAHILDIRMTVELSKDNIFTVCLFLPSD